MSTALFTPETRTDTLKEMYEAAAKTPVPVMDELDRILGENRRRSSDAFMCTPVLGQIRRRMKGKVDLEIEARIPTAIENLRKWTSQEAIGDITVGTDAVSRVFSCSSANNSQFAMSRDETDDTLHSTYNNSSAITSRSNTNDSINDATLDHRLPSPEEQQKVIALKYPAETIRVDVSGKRFDRMSAARKSLLHVQMGGGTGTIADGDGAEDGGAESGGDTIRRRSRSRKPRGKRRNTIAGIDGKEIQEAANGEASGESQTEDPTAADLVPRSKSSDILKKDEKTRVGHFNSLKQWGRNRLRQITLRGSSGSENAAPIDKQVSDIDDFNTQDTMRMNNAFRKRQLEKEKEKRLSHERKPSYSSQSEKSVAAVSSLSTIPVAVMNPVKLRESSLIRRQRRHGLGQKEEQNSSSGNWSASSESGRTSIGSEITTTTHPKSSASSGSLNHHHHGGSSGPPSSIISRRRFLNTSASSSITSEGTATPDLQTFGDFHDEGETSSIYSCDTEGYYTSFHMDSGLKTLKEEEPATPLHTSQNLSSTTSFESSGNQTVISPENEYELFGRGSTSTTTSSAGTICTIVLPTDYDRTVPQVPERKSSLTKLNRSSSSVSNSNTGSLERSYSSSTVGSTLERMGTIKRNGVLLQKEVQTLVKEEALKVQRTESPDSGNNTSSSPIESNANSSPTQSQQSQGVRSNSEFEYSESSDLESVDRIERIRVKTTINTSRIPSMCVITPGNSDDDEIMKNRKNSDSSEELMAQVIEIAFGDETPMNESQIKKMAEEPSKTIYDVPHFKKEVFKKTTLLPLGNFMGKLKGVLNKKSPNKDVVVPANEIYATSGEYVTIADVANNNKKQHQRNSGVYYSNDVVKRNLATVLSGNLNEETEYVSLNELPCNIRCESNLLSDTGTDAANTTTRESNTNTTNTTIKNENSSSEGSIKGARVTLDAHGKVVYSSDSLKRRKGAHTTFAPGPNVKDTKQSTESVASETARSEDEYIEIPPAISSPLLSGGVLNRKLHQKVRPVVSQQRLNSPIVETLTNTNTMRGAYVNLQEAQNPLMTQSNYEDYQLSSHDPHFNGALMSQSSYISSTLPRFQNSPIYESPPVAYATIGDQFQQRNDQMYWTLQSGRKSNRFNTYGLSDDLNIAQPDIPIEQLYSTPNKLRTTRHGFDNYFSPVLSEGPMVGKVHESKSRDNDSSISKISPIDPRNTGNGSFQTSTPAKGEGLPTSPTKGLSEELRNRLRLGESGIRSSGNSPINSGRSTPRLEPQARSRHSWASQNAPVPETCADRMKQPKTSLMDFKRLLLEKQATNAATKKSAVEQLLMQQAPQSPTATIPKTVPNSSSMHILDLSGSPKTFATRRMLRQGNFGTSSPVKSNVPKHVSPKTGWRYNNLRSDVISTAIPEVNSEEDQSPNNSAQRLLAKNSPSPPRNEENVVVEEKMSVRDNIFLKTEENNFMKHELLQNKQQLPVTGIYTRAQLQAQRAQFLLGTNNAATNGAKSRFNDQATSPTSAVTDSVPPALETSL